MTDLLNFQTSFLNPLLKIIVPLILLYGTFYFYRARNTYGGEIGKMVRRLAMAGVIGALAMAFRYMGDIVDISWKWGESLGYFAWGLANIYAVWPLLRFVQKLQKDEN